MPLTSSSCPCAASPQVMPLRKEASCLRSENNVLHEAMIRKEDEVGARDRSSTLEKRKLKNQLAFAIEGCKERDVCIMEIELKTKRLRDALRKALPPATAAEEPLLVGTDEDTGEAGRDFRWSSARWSSDGEGTERGGVVTRYGGHDGNEISTITLEVHQLEVEGLKNSVEMRDTEIARLCEQLDNLNEKVLNSVTLHSTHENNKSIIEQLHQQVDFLNSQLAIREAQLQKAHCDVREAEIELSKAKVEVDEYRYQLTKRSHQVALEKLSAPTESASQEAEEESKKSAADASLFAVTQECSSLLERVQQLEAELRYVRSVAEESRDQVERAERRLKEQLEDIACLTTRAERAEENVDITTRECMALTEQLRTLEENKVRRSPDNFQDTLNASLLNEQYKERIKYLQEQLSDYRNGLVSSQSAKEGGGGVMLAISTVSLSLNIRQRRIS